MAITTQGVHLIYGGTSSSPSWVKITLKNSTPSYSSSRTYAVGDLVVQSSKLYQCITAISTPEAFNSSKWQEIADRDLCIKDFPDITNGSPDEVETTTLCDSTHKNIDGLGNLPDELDFTANFDNDLYNVVAGRSAEAHWGIQIGEGVGSPQWVFKATAFMELVGAGAGDVLEMRIKLKPKSSITKQSASA